MDEEIWDAWESIVNDLTLDELNILLYGRTLILNGVTIPVGMIEHIEYE